MGWGKIRRGFRRARLSWTNDDRTVAVGVCAAQLPAAWLLSLFSGSVEDDYGVGIGGPALGLGLACALLFAPLVLPILGLVQTVAQITPAALLAHLSVRRLRGPGWAWHLLYVVLLGACWAMLPAAWWGRPFTATALVLAALGTLPVLGVAYARRRARATERRWGALGVWWRGGLGCFGLCGLALVGGLLVTATGLIEEYEPPKLSAAQLAGLWRGDDGAALKLLPGGRAQLTDLPAEPEFGADSAEDFEVCDGMGTWWLDTEGRDDRWGGQGPQERDGVVVRLDDDCAEQTYWTIGGTAHEPELFVLFGDPDAGDLRILKRD
ncbi:hypothetical protein QQY66_20745 [Streptomyces sp. DG2A-72]|uniref:hypothetical protein n=1 Tax=Streptomyces sp. DG2A-72 TaxID=3051386 RepID=UPI00265B7C92|nr:hypothetical protein [Streptomyces sp. DG2A-72]MDO0933995.1 hypothetical protein [Streptomyces sp. DG2A-72]